jgi:hypothetical protein
MADSHSDSQVGQQLAGYSCSQLNGAARLVQLYAVHEIWDAFAVQNGGCQQRISVSYLSSLGILMLVN